MQRPDRALLALRPPGDASLAPVELEELVVDVLAKVVLPVSVQLGLVGGGEIPVQSVLVPVQSKLEGARVAAQQRRRAHRAVRVAPAHTGSRARVAIAWFAPHHPHVPYDPHQARHMACTQ